MARYIDADALTEQLKVLEIFITGMLCGKTRLTEVVEEYKKSALRLIDEQPTADVVPRAELENLQDELDLYGFVYGVTPDKQKVIGKVRSDVAREIFGEVEELLREWFDFFRQGNDIRESCAIMAGLSQVSELKKKYTEGEK